MAMGDGFTKMELELIEAAADCAIARHGDIAECRKHLSINTDLLPGRDKGAITKLHFKLILVDFYYFDFEHLLDVFSEEGIGEGDQTARNIHPFLDAVSMNAPGLEYG